MTAWGASEEADQWMSVTCQCEALVWQLKMCKPFTIVVIYKWPPHRSSQLEKVSQQLACHHHQHLNYYECCKQATGTCRDDFRKLERQPQQDGWVGWTGPSYIRVCTLFLRQLASPNPYSTILFSTLTTLPLIQPSTLDFKMNKDGG